MAVHVDEIHTDVTASRAVSDPESTGGHDAGHAHGGDRGSTGRPGVAEDVWLRAESRVSQLRCRVAAEGFDD